MEGTTSQSFTKASQALGQLDSWKQNSQRLQLEAFKIEQMITQFNNCADRCKLQYKESGIKGAVSEEVECFSNCVVKTHNLGKLMFQ